jgi:antitoxin MazE
MESSVQKWGNSSAVRLPKPLLKTAGITERDKVQILAKKNEIIIRKAEKRHIPLAARLKGWDGVYEAVEIDWGPPVGKEVW